MSFARSFKSPATMTTTSCTLLPNVPKRSYGCATFSATSSFRNVQTKASKVSYSFNTSIKMASCETKAQTSIMGASVSVSKSKQQKSITQSFGKSNTKIVDSSCLASFTSVRLDAVRKNSIGAGPKIYPPNPSDHGKLTVVLDVDETLIHSRLSPSQDKFRQKEERKECAGACEEFKITLEDGETIWVNKRPGLDEFLKHMSENYETIAYTAGLEEYAKPLLDWLDPEGKIFRYRLYRDSCLFIRGYYVKDLEKLNRDLGRVVLVDNNAFCFLPQLSNGIPISSFYDDPNDNALQVLMSFLQKLREETDVRPFLNKSFNLQNLLRDHREHIIG